MPDINCRVSKAEQKLDTICDQFKAHAADEHEQLEEIRTLIANIQNKIDSQKSFIQGISFTLSALAAVVGTVWHYFTGNGS